MADTGFNWDASWTAMPITDGGDGVWTADALADNAVATGDAVSLDGKAACEVGFAVYEDNTGAINGVVTVYILGDVDGTNYEEPGTAGTPASPSGAWTFTITPVQNDTVYKRVAINPGNYGSFKTSVLNEGGQEVAITVKYRCATVPAAS